MATVGSYAEVLRAIGAQLDVEGARALRVTEDEDYITVSWPDDAGRWPSRAYYKGPELDRLQAQARKMRGGGPSEAEPSWEERLRTLGQELDAAGIQLTSLTERRGFEVIGLVGGKSVRRWYSTDELGKKSGDRRTLRGKQAAPRPRWWRRLLPAHG